MSTLTPPRSSQKPLPQTLQQPLSRLHAAIRRYVELETLALVVVAVVVWAAMCLIIDWGILFKLFGFDYVREGTTSLQAFLRGSALFILIAGLSFLVLRYLVLRLIKPITTSDLAMAIERRYGNQLGDRLVTAVELHDWEAARSQGYSPAMIEATTTDAERALADVSVDDVLNRPRLRRRLFIAGACLVVAVLSLLLVPEVTATYLERGLLWRNVTWPRTTVLELADFVDRAKAVPFGTELKVTVRSAKWALADRTVSEGWRPLYPSDLTSNAPAWELEDLTGVTDFLTVLPAGWQSASLDQLESRLSEGDARLQRELGLALIRHLQNYFWEHRQDGATLPAALASYLPEKLKAMPVEEQKIALATAASLSSSDAERILTGLTALRPTTGDMALALVRVGATPAPWPLPPLSLIQKMAFDRDSNMNAFAMPEQDKLLLPPSWQNEPIRDLAKRLKSFAAEESAESLGLRVKERGVAIFAELAQRAARTRFASRKSFRELTVPEKLTLEFENQNEGDDRTRGRAKRGQPELKRIAGTNEFAYDFKKMERPLRLRALVGKITTPWYRVEVKPLPVLKSLVRFHEEPGYLHGSNSTVKLGPLVLPIDGEESRATAPLGANVWFEGESQKPLKFVKLTTENPADAPMVEFKPGETKFILRPRNKLKDDLRAKLEFADMDGIVASRTLLLILTPDKPPEFGKAQFEAVNRKFITNKALLPLSIAVRDDVGLLGLEYEVSLQKNDRTPVFEVRVPFRIFSPVRFHEHQPGGLQFESRDDLTLPRILAQLSGNEGADPLHLQSTAGRLPAGWLSVFPPLHVSFRREFNHDYVDRQLFGPVLNYTDEYLDTLQLRTALGKPSGEPLLDTPYRLVVKLVARDNHLNEQQSASQEGRANEAFEFNVVSEQDVLIEGGKREEDLRDKLEESIVALRKVRSSLKRIRDEIDTPTPARDEEVRRGMNDAQDATKSLAQIRGLIDEKVLREFRQIYREFALNRVDVRVLDRIDRRICQPLAILLQPEQLYAKLENSVDTLARRLETEGSSLPKGLLSDPVNQADRVLQRLDEILNDMRKLIEFNEALRVLRDLINNEQKLVEEMKKLIQQKLKNDLDDK
ncbi:MAG: hypothetical protein U0796_11020 [Gemmatales bacterium]